MTTSAEQPPSHAGDTPANPGSVPPEASAPPTPEEQLAALQAKLTEANDSFLRAKAEAENTRRRSEEEISKARKFAIESFADSLLPVRDSLEAAIAIENATPAQLLEGVHATLRQLNQALERNKVLAINPPAGTKFDPHQHQAISVVPAPQEPNTVVSVLQKGYLISDVCCGLRWSRLPARPDRRLGEPHTFGEPRP